VTKYCRISRALSSPTRQLLCAKPAPHTKAAKMATSVDAKLLKSTKFPVEFNQKVDMQKVNVEVMKK
jgi:hypothetical protein